jgi:hypothetical protein
MWNAGPGNKGRVFNNLILYREGYAGRFVTEPNCDIEMDGNLHWALQKAEAAPTNYFTAVRTARPASTNQNEAVAGWEVHSFSADPKLQAVQVDWRAANDYLLLPNSAAIGKGIPLPKEYADPFRPEGDRAPDIGAIPFGGEQLKVGIDGRVIAGRLDVPK